VLDEAGEFPAAASTVRLLSFDCGYLEPMLSKYLGALRNQAAVLGPSDQGTFWASQVVSAPEPDDAEAWKARGVTAGYAENVQHGLILAAVDQAVADPVVAGVFVAEIRSDAATSRRLVESGLMPIIVTRTLNNGDADPSAAVTVIRWASAELPDDAARLEATLAALSAMNGDRLAQCVNVVERAASPFVVREARRLLDARLRALAEQAQQEAAANELRELRQAMLQQPAETWQLLARRYGVSEATAPTPNLKDFPLLIEAASQLIDRERSRGIPVATEVNAVLGAALEQRLSGEAFLEPANSVLNSYERLVVTRSASVGQFWDNLAKMADRECPEPKQVQQLFEEWRHSRIRQGHDARTVTVLGERAGWSGLAKPPSLEVSVEVAGASVLYPDIDSLLADLREYFVPMPGREGVAGEISRAALAGSASGAAALDKINAGYDVRNMDALSIEIREWAAGIATEYWDKEAQGSGTPYKYGPGLFSGHGIGVRRCDDGTFALRFVGGGYGPSGPDMLEDYAAFIGVDVAYDGIVKVHMTVMPTSNIDRIDLALAPTTSNGAVCEATLPFPVDELARYVSSLTDGSASQPDVLQAIMGRSDDTDNPVVITDAVEVEIGGNHRAIATADQSGDAVAKSTMRSGANGGVEMVAPRLDISILFSDSATQNRLATTLRSAQREGLTHHDGRDVPGSPGQYGIFVFDAGTSAEIGKRAMALVFQGGSTNEPTLGK
jgi:hypothetical protein